ncbi:MAG: triose-phosphate isomerase [Candidatus Paracaedibacteraceae bacterium]|nr:triose-phosphate isomerase [Candidatus Paracaedibacteraceae bacterium]
MSLNNNSKKPYIVSNWKMNGTKALLHEAMPVWQPFASKAHWIFCPPATLIMETKECFSKVIIGGQDCSSNLSGAFTGSISAAQLAEAGASYVILGHSECRQYRGDTNAIVAEKAIAALSQGLTPIICIGESLETHAANETLTFLKQQLVESIANISGKFFVAYEPIWAIGTGKTATLHDIEHVHHFLREQQPGVPLLYGGSVNAQNAGAITELENVDGLLVGGVSLKIEEFKELLRSVHGISALN